VLENLYNAHIHARSEVESSRNALVRIQAFYIVPPRRLVNGYRRFGGSLYFILQGQAFKEQTSWIVRH
jgi:hypothetical protein